MENRRKMQTDTQTATENDLDLFYHVFVNAQDPGGKVRLENLR